MESSKNLEVIRNSDYIIGDLEQMRLTSKTYVIKRAVQKN